MRLFECFELIFDGPVLTASWANVDLEAVFEDAAGSHPVKGFYAGDGKYIIRFLPEVTGPVSWKVSGLLQAEGSDFCQPAAPSSHGIVRPSGTALKFSDDSWFFSFGTTVYALAHQTPELTEQTFETLKSSPFNKVRMCVFPKHYDYNVNDPEHFPFFVKDGMQYSFERGATFNSSDFLSAKAPLWDVSRPDPAFWDAFEEKIRRLDSLGIQVDLILFHPYDRWGFSFLSQQDNLLYLDYLLRRLSAFPNIWWSMANEYDLCAAKTLDDWHEIESFLAANDPYHHMLSNHNCFPAYDFGREAITHCSLQKRNMALVPEYALRYGKPVLYDECVYEGNLKQTWGSLSGAEMTNRFWKVTSCGGYCTHGEVFLDADMENIDEAVLWWAKGGTLIGSSPARIAFLRSIIEEIGQPLEYYSYGTDGLIRAYEAGNTEVLNGLPASLAKLIRVMGSMDPVERCRHHDQELNYAGHAGEDAYLFYYGTDCCARVDIPLSLSHTYRVEVIDAWNMTRETVAQGVSGSMEIKLPGREYMAVLAIRED